MSITAWLTPGPLPRVIIESTSLPSGASFSLLAESGGVTWTVAWGTRRNAGPALWADTRAPLGAVTTYTLQTATLDGPATHDVASVTRTATTGDVLCSADGRTVAPIRRRDQDPYSWAPRVEFFEVPDAYYPAWSASGTSGSATSQIVVATEPSGTAALRALVEAQRPVLLLHDPTRPGHRPDCDVEPVRSVLISSASQATTGRIRPQRAWNLTVRDVDHPSQPVPVATWDEAKALGWTWSPGLSWHQVARAIALGLTQAEALEVTEPQPAPVGLVFDEAVFDLAVFE